MKLKIKKLHPAAITPTYGTPGAACFDLYAATVDGFAITGSTVWSGFPATCDTGLAFEVPEGHVMMIFSRSGHGFKNDIRLANCTGVIDSDYRGSVQVKLTCDRQGDGEKAPFNIKQGDRVAQAMIIPVPTVEFVLADQLGTTERGAAGFGSTGS
jgi:dUTP pyrophosphatase